MIPKEALDSLRFRKGKLYETSHKGDIVRQRISDFYIRDVNTKNTVPHYRNAKQMYTFSLKIKLENHGESNINVDVPENIVMGFLFGGIYDVYTKGGGLSKGATIYKRFVVYEKN